MIRRVSFAPLAANQALQVALTQADAIIMPVNPSDPWSVSEYVNTVQLAADNKMAFNYNPPKVGFITNKIESNTLPQTIAAKATELSEMLEGDVVPRGNVSFLGKIRSCPTIFKQSVEHGPPLALHSPGSAAGLVDDLAAAASGLEGFLSTVATNGA